MSTSDKFENRVAQYIALRDAISKLKEKHEKELEPFATTLNNISAWLMEHLESVGAKSVKTTEGTVYTNTRYTASLEDPQAFMNFVITQAKYDLLDRKANSTAVRDYVEQNGSLPPGAKLSAIRTIGVRRASE